MGHEDAILNERPVGVLIPPPETKKIIDKAAELVAKYGSSAEATLRSDEKNLPKFSFLNEGDPYRAYYDQKVNELAKNFAVNKNLSKDTKLLGKKMENTSDASNINSFNPSQRNNSIQNELRKMIEEKRMEKVQLAELKPPAPDQFSISHPNISPLDMDIIKATAQFVARNGQRFLTGLSEREMKNPQFDFLKPQHNLFGYFTYLVESYAKCLKKEDITKLNALATDKETILKRATDRYLWDKKSREAQKRKDLIDESERTQMAQIDWCDFAIVGVVDFTEEELFNTVPIYANESQAIYANVGIDSIDGNVNSLLKMQNAVPMNNIMEEEKNISSSSVNLAPEEFETPVPETLPEPNMKIVKNYTRKTVTETTKKDTVKCPLCREWINVDDWPLHIKVELLDPKWKEINQEIQERKMEINIAPTGDFLNYLSDFSRYRPDLFGDVKDVVKIEEKKKIEAKASTTTIWDGYAPNMTRTTANIAMLAQQTRKNFEESRKIEGLPQGGNTNEQNPNTTGNAPLNTSSSGRVGNISISSGRLPNANVIPLSVTQQKAQINSQNESNLNPNTNSNNNQTGPNDIDFTNLMPEETFLKKNSKPFKLNIKIPDRREINDKLQGQITGITVNPQDTLAEIKAKIVNYLNETNNLDKFIIKSFSNKQLEESHSAAYYNLHTGSIIELDKIN